MDTYVIVNQGPQKGIKCLRCGSVSWNRNDVEQLYCGQCHSFHVSSVSEKEFKARCPNLWQSLESEPKYRHTLYGMKLPTMSHRQFRFLKQDIESRTSIYRYSIMDSPSGTTEPIHMN